MFERRRETEPGVEHDFQEEAHEAQTTNFAKHSVDDGAHGLR